MENLKEQIFQATSDFVAALQQLTEQHTARVFQETFSSLGNGDSTKRAAAPVVSAALSRGAKRGADELEQLSKRFVQFVQENPGLRIEQINKQLGTSTSALALPIRKLLASGDISVKGQKRSTAYFAGKRAAEPAAARTAGKGSTAGKTRKGKASKKSARSKKSGRSKSKKK